MNVQGEEQKKLDVVTNDVLKRALTFTGKVSIVTGQSRLGFEFCRKQCVRRVCRWL